MSMEKLFICLANSKKYNERCIAGIELELERSSWPEGGPHDINIVRTETENPKWIRPVSAAQSGAVSAELVDHVSLLDIVKLNVTAPAPQGYQSENVLFDGGSLEIIRRFPRTVSLIEILFEKSFDSVSHQVNRSDVNHSFSSLRIAFIIQGQSTKPTKPRKCALNNPS